MLHAPLAELYISVHEDLINIGYFCFSGALGLRRYRPNDIVPTSEIDDGTGRLFCQMYLFDNVCCDNSIAVCVDGDSDIAGVAVPIFALTIDSTTFI